MTDKSNEKAMTQNIDILDECVSDGDFDLVAGGIDYLRSIGYGNMADAIERMAIRDELSRDGWVLCACGARIKGAFGYRLMRCPVCDDNAITPCICVEFNRWSRTA